MVARPTPLACAPCVSQLYRDNIIFHEIVIKKFPATFGSQRKMMLFLWKVPRVKEERTEASNDQTVQLVTKRLPEIHSRETRSPAPPWRKQWS